MRHMSEAERARRLLTGYRLQHIVSLAHHNPTNFRCMRCGMQGPSVNEPYRLDMGLWSWEDLADRDARVFAVVSCG